MKSRIPWAQKMNMPSAYEVKEGPELWNKKYGGSNMVIPPPRIIEKILFEIPKGKVITTSQLREHIADQCNADYACPLTTGIFLRICSEYAEELRKEKSKKIPPYWRVVKDDGSLNEKFPGGTELQSKHLTEEGHKLILIGKIKKRPAILVA
jgi:6-O-methylguanine DNA methyltransferase, DNA binding domain